MSHRFYIVDVFAENAYSGNQLAVVIGEEPISDENMQKIASEINYSETTFVTPTPMRDGGYQVRIFTPAREVDFAGHPILGTAWVLRHYVVPDAREDILLNLSVGQIAVTFEITSHGDEVAWFIAPPVSLGRVCAREPMAAALGISADEIDAAFPVQQASAGTSAMIVPLRSLDALRRCSLDLHKFEALSKQGFPSLIYLFSTETHFPQNDLCARFFFEAHGVREDPATGNGAAFLGAYILEHDYFSRPLVSLRIEQGYEVRRASLVLLRAQKAGGGAEIRVGGSVIPVVQGELI